MINMIIYPEIYGKFHTFSYRIINGRRHGMIILDPRSSQEIIILSREGDQRNADLETVGPLKNQQLLRKSFNPQTFPLEKNGKDPGFLWISQWISQL